MARSRRKARPQDQVGYTAAPETRDGFLTNGKAQVPAVTPQFVGMGSQYTSPRRGTRELLALYKDSPWLRAIVGKIARHVADTDWFMVAPKSQNGKYILDTDLQRLKSDVRNRELNRLVTIGRAEKIQFHPLLDMLREGTGNPRLNGHGALAVTQQHLDLAGEAFWILEKDQLGVPNYYWPIPPDWVKNFPTNSNPYYRLSAPGGLQIDIPITEIVPFIDPDPSNPYARGVGTAQSLDDEIQIDEFASKHQKAFFLNRARPDIIISGQFISPKDSERLEKQWLSDHQGFWKSFKPLFFSQKIDVKELSQTFEQMQMVQVRKAERDTFISVFGAPPEKFGIIGESKRSTIQAADYFWTKDIIQPRVEMMRRVMQQVVVPMFDTRLVLAYETPVIQDDELKLATMKSAPWSFSINQWQEAAGFPGLGERGEFLVVPINMTLLPLDDPTANVPAPGGGGDGSSDSKARMLEAMKQAHELRGPSIQADVNEAAIAEAVAAAVASVLEANYGKIRGLLTHQT